MRHLIMSPLVKPDLACKLAVDDKEIGCHQHHTEEPPGQPHLQGMGSYGSLSVCGSLHTCSSTCSVMSCPPAAMPVASMAISTSGPSRKQKWWEGANSELSPRETVLRRRLERDQHFDGSHGEVLTRPNVKGHVLPAPRIEI